MCNASRASLNDRASHTDKRGYNTHMYQPPPPQALCFSHGRGERETRVTGHEPQGTIGKVQTEGLSPTVSFSPSFARTSKRDVWVRGSTCTL